MRKLVQHKATKAFMTETGTWTTDCGQAQHFPTFESVTRAMTTHRLNAVDLYYLFDEQPSEYDFTISLKLPGLFPGSPN